MTMELQSSKWVREESHFDFSLPVGGNSCPALRPDEAHLPYPHQYRRIGGGMVQCTGCGATRRAGSVPARLIVKEPV